ncbi:MotA/TolQ/ExbB proton channel family protein [Aliikangiella maris]|uniref:MotA/TolQ/ExbB proton channel family protein n=2 Tax=Aliikangiella maris TaxID=3162458 RepID=A0ABV2BRW5_9GAMM
MLFLEELLETVTRFIEAGGDVLWFIAAALVVMWSMIIERLWYFSRTYPKQARLLVAQWDQREDTTSWHAHKIREAWISQMREKLHSGLLVIKTIVTICPMIGLLGTVTGMINVFEVMALSGTGSARLMAAGITQATIPTMAGMVAALSGLFISSRLEYSANVHAQELADHMPHH